MSPIAIGTILTIFCGTAAIVLALLPSLYPPALQAAMLPVVCRMMTYLFSIAVVALIYRTLG